MLRIRPKSPVFYSLSNITLMEENVSSFHQRFRHCLKGGKVVFSIPSAIKATQLHFVTIRSPNLAILSM